MNYSLHSNGWTVYVDLDLKTCSQDDVKLIAKLISTNVVVVFKNQSLTVDDELRLVHMFKSPVKQFEKDYHRYDDYVVDPDAFICRVTAGLRNGKPGMGGWKSAHDWHVDDANIPARCDLLYLHGVKGTKHSRTSFTNGLLAYKDLDDEIKNTISDLHCIYSNTYAPMDPDFTKLSYNDKWIISIVRENNSGNKGLYYIPFQMQKFIELPQDESDKLKEKLTNHIFNDKYVYHHDWEDGDIVISDQWYGMHKRWPFDKMDERLLHRASMSYPAQDYTE
jgi:alpha-ketoglutarate-dependent taurine dioxygenase